MNVSIHVAEEEARVTKLPVLGYKPPTHRLHWPTKSPITLTHISTNGLNNHKLLFEIVTVVTKISTTNCIHLPLIFVSAISKDKKEEPVKDTQNEWSFC